MAVLIIVISAIILLVIGLSQKNNSHDKTYTSTQRINGTNKKSNGTTSDCCSRSVIDLGNGYVRVKREYLDKRYIRGAIMDDDLFWEYNDSGYVEIPKTKLDSMEERRIAYMKMERSIQRIAMLNNKGIELEKLGEIQEAIRIYEKNISYGDCNAAHPYDRLLVLYRKQKDYENEKRICELAISIFKGENKYKDRLEKINNLISKMNEHQN